MSTSEPQVDRPKLLRHPSWQAVCGILLFTYVISIGPTAAVLSDQLNNPHCIAYRFWQTIYGPLLWLGETVPLLGSLLKQYINLFGISK